MDETLCQWLNKEMNRSKRKMYPWKSDLIQSHRGTSDLNIRFFLQILSLSHDLDRILSKIQND